MPLCSYLPSENILSLPDNSGEAVSAEGPWLLVLACGGGLCWSAGTSLDANSSPDPNDSIHFLLLSLSVLLLFSDDSLWCERFLQLSGLEGSWQQCGHQSDGGGLCLSRNPQSMEGRRLHGDTCTGSAWKGLPVVFRLVYPTLRNPDLASGVAHD